MTTPHVSSGINPGVLMNKTAMLVGAGLIAFLTACVTVLAALDKDTGAILDVINMFAIPVLAILGYAKLTGMERTTEAVRQQTNGSQQQQAEFTREVVQQAITIALAQQPPKQPGADSETVS